ncbi:TVP38/TMEM64 family protein [Bacillus sp. CGMCC 1.16607]|uniref:TVP38/TMEM64 family protein n=1 Tax=Bacillus sp. CGMCC 1.16607 TaxID=3351842 RepID=UPI003640D46C
MKRIFPIILSVITIYLGFSQKSFLLDTVQSESYFAIPTSILFVAILVFFPIIPYVVLAGMIGSVFGVFLGTGISLIGIGLGTITMFFLSRYGFQDWSQNYLKKYPKIQQYEGIFEKNAFISILLARLIPVIPSPLVNILSGLSKIQWHVFFSASLLGKMPAIFTFTLAGSLIGNQKWLSVIIYAVYFITIAILVGRKIQKNKLSEQIART